MPGDYFALTSGHLQWVAHIYDRAALVALPGNMRFEYTEHLQRIVPVSAEIFAILIDYDQSLMEGPPFSVPESEVRSCFADRYQIDVLQREASHIERRGLDHLIETTYRLVPEFR